MQKLVTTFMILTLALFLGRCATAVADPATSHPGPVASVPAGAVQVEAKDIAFSQKTVDAPAAKAFSLYFTNHDSAPHNISISANADGSNPVFTGEIFANGQRIYQIPALATGTYHFRCDVHPNMTGTIVVK
jgi:plastocyanin